MAGICAQTSFYEQEVRHLSECPGSFFNGSQIFPPPMAAKGATARLSQVSSKCPRRRNGCPCSRVIEGKKSRGWGVAFVDGSKECEGGVEYAGHGVWFAENGDRNESSPVLVPVGERQYTALEELTGALRAPQNNCPGIPLHLVTDSELVYSGLTGKCEKWKQHKWVGSRGPLAYRDLWLELCDQWLLLGESANVQLVPSHVGAEGKMPFLQQVIVQGSEVPSLGTFSGTLSGKMGQGRKNGGKWG